MNLRRETKSKLLITLIAIFALLATFAYAQPNPGHSLDELECSGVFCINTVDGRVGVGTTTPTYSLEVIGEVKADSFVGDFTGEVTDGLRVYGPADSTGGLTLDADAQDTFRFWTDSSNVGRIGRGGSGYLNITTGGNVGIGTTAPGMALDVDGDLGVRNNLYITNQLGINTTSPNADSKIDVAGMSGDKNITLGEYGTDGLTSTNFVGTRYYWDTDNLQVGLRDYGSDDKHAVFNIEQSGDAFRFQVAGNDKFFIDGNGRVGVGTTAPGAALDVSGKSILRGGFSTDGDASLQRSGTDFIQFEGRPSVNMMQETRMYDNLDMRNNNLTNVNQMDTNELTVSGGFSAGGSNSDIGDFSVRDIPWESCSPSIVLLIKESSGMNVAGSIYGHRSTTSAGSGRGVVQVSARAQYKNGSTEMNIETSMVGSNTPREVEAICNGERWYGLEMTATNCNNWNSSIFVGKTAGYTENPTFEVVSSSSCDVTVLP